MVTKLNAPVLIEIEKLLFENDSEKISVFHKGKKAFESLYEANPENSDSTYDSNREPRATTPKSGNSKDSYKIEFAGKGGHKTTIECFRETTPQKKSCFSRPGSELACKSAMSRKLTLAHDSNTNLASKYPGAVFSFSAQNLDNFSFSGIDSPDFQHSPSPKKDNLNTSFASEGKSVCSREITDFHSPKKLSEESTDINDSPEKKIPKEDAVALKKRQSVYKDGECFMTDGKLLSVTWWTDDNNLLRKMTQDPNDNFYFTGCEYEFDQATKNNNLVYQGDFDVNGQKHGFGAEFDPETGRKIYLGYFENNHYNGDGKRYWEFDPKTDRKGPKVRYNGQFSKDQRDGRGVLYWRNGQKKYDGYWKNDQRKGSGKQYLKDGVLLYSGGWAQDLHFGRGRAYYSDGTLAYTGTFLKGGYEGHGVEYWPNGRVKYDGHYLDSKYNGHGVAYWESGLMKYNGGWFNNKYQGRGDKYNARGELLCSGLWKESYLKTYSLTVLEKELDFFVVNIWMNPDASVSNNFETGYFLVGRLYPRNKKQGVGYIWIQNVMHVAYEGAFELQNPKKANKKTEKFAIKNNQVHDVKIHGNFNENSSIVKKHGYGKEFTQVLDVSTVGFIGNFQNDLRHGTGASYWPNGKLKSRGLFHKNILKMNVPYIATSEIGSLLVRPEESLSVSKRKGWFSRRVGKIFGCGTS
jgi:antitoxin component YwqK of YwqJK toxin-antitoxin module